MAYILQGQIELGLFINDVEYPLSAVNKLNFLHVGVLASLMAPTIHFSLDDVEHVIDQIPFQDGIPLRVTVKYGTADTQVFHFRMFHHDRSFSGHYWTYAVDGYWDNPQWFSGTTNKGYQGTSNNVLSTIASELGLRYSGVSTNDNQLWHPQNMRYSEFANKIANAGFIDPNSCMALALDLDGVLRYRNISNLPETPIEVVAYQLKVGALTAADYKSKADSGFGNVRTGYWDSRVRQSTVNPKTYDKVGFTSDARAPLYNLAVKEKAKAGGVRYSPIDVGNTHANFDLATYQNIRLRNLYSQSLEVLFNQQTTLRCFDKVNFSVQKEDTTQDTTNSGIYIVTGRAFFVQGANYGEKVLIQRHGNNATYTTG